MTEAIDRPALDEVEIALAAIVPQPGAFAAHEYGRRARRDLHQRVKRMYGIGHVDLLLRGVKRPAETQEGRTFSGAAFSKTLLIDLIQRCRRTRRNPSSSLMRRRKAARRLVRFRFIAQAHTAEGQVMSSAGCFSCRALNASRDR